MEEMIELKKNIFPYPLTTYYMGLAGIFTIVATICKTRLVGRFGRRERR